MSQRTEISRELQNQVSWAVAILGKAIQQEYGRDIYQKIESSRKKMKTIRGGDPDQVFHTLSQEMRKYQKLNNKQIHQICNGFSLMLEVINRCEMAYRTHRLKNNVVEEPKKKPHAIVFVMTAHPTEARSPQLLGLFESIQQILVESLDKGLKTFEEELYHFMLLALRISLAVGTKPSVKDEANNVYSYILHDRILEKIIDFSFRDINVSLRSWVGGDKDGHPGVDEKTMVTSLNLSRYRLVEFTARKISKALSFVALLEDDSAIHLQTQMEFCLHQLMSLKNIKRSDGLRISEFKKSFHLLIKNYKNSLHVLAPELKQVEQLIWIFPALVVPLEVREDSAVVKEALKNEQAINRMLTTLKEVSKGLDPKWYVRGFVLSMVMDANDVLNGIKLVKRSLGGYNIPVVPLFENEQALSSAVEILSTVLKSDAKIVQKHQSHWGGRYEVMVGYSDSSKENGVLPSRLMISTALKKIEKNLQELSLTPVFFHGSGGSIERGGGSLKEQTGWWPKSAINIYKATIQGEMVARNFASEEILGRQVQIILEQLGTFKTKGSTQNKVLKVFADKIRKNYSEKVQDEEFLSIIEFATPYKFLHHLKIGSRPTKRSSGTIKNNLRAIPWILCWTQTRTLFPTWWGVGSAWEELSSAHKKDLKLAFSHNPVFTSYVKALGFTLAKIELGVWKTYLVNSNISAELREKTYLEFCREVEKTKSFFSYVTGNKDFLWFRPWLQQSINLRSSMIHPLNICQLEALRRSDMDLLRSSVTGIACGMMTTG